MVTSTATVADPYQKLTQVQADLTKTLNEFRESQRKLLMLSQERNTIEAQIMGSIGAPIANHQPIKSAAPAAAQTAPAAKGKPGPKPGQKKAAKPAAAKATGGRNYTNTKPLVQVCFEVIERQEYSGGGETLGIRPGEVMKIIKGEKLFTTSSENGFPNMVSGAIGKLKTQGLVARTPEGGYYVPQGVTWPTKEEPAAE